MSNDAQRGPGAPPPMAISDTYQKKVRDTVILVREVARSIAEHDLRRFEFTHDSEDYKVTISARR